MKTAIQSISKTPAPRSGDTCTVPCFKEDLVSEIRAWLPDDQTVRRTAGLYGALADPSRLKILLALSRGELCVCDVSHVVGLSVSATSHQLRTLRNLNLVEYRNDGRMAYYSLRNESEILPLLNRTAGR